MQHDRQATPPASSDHPPSARRTIVNVFKYEKHFLPRISEDQNGCWNWLGDILRNGYGRLTYQNKGRLVHRFSYEWHVGPIPEGLQIDHLCRNRHCCNPQHLEAVTPRVNTLRGHTIVAANAAKTVCPLGHPLSGDNLYLKPGRHRICIACRKLQSKKYRDTDEYRTYNAARQYRRRHGLANPA